MGFLNRLFGNKKNDAPSKFSNEISTRNPQKIYKEAKSLSKPQEMPRKIMMLQQALSLVQRQSNSKLWAAIQLELGNSLNQNPQGNIAENIEKAIEHYKQALDVFTRQDFIKEWTITQNNLATAFINRIWGDQAENIEKAIEHSNKALEVCTYIEFPLIWAGIQNNLAIAYENRIRGDYAQNIEMAIYHCNQSLNVFTPYDFPLDWAKIQINLTAAFIGRIIGDKAENIEQAIKHCNRALEVINQNNFSVDWALAQNNLGLAYNDRIRGNRAQNIKKAIEHHNKALDVYTLSNFPVEWARAHMNLANAHCDYARVNRTENAEKAVYHYNNALEVYTYQDFPVEWALTQNNLGSFYWDRFGGDRGENIEKAIYHYNQALKVRTRQDFPFDWALTQNNLGLAYRDRTRGDGAENIEQAIYHYTQALEIYTYQSFPVKWAMTQNNMAIAFIVRVRGDRAENIEIAIEHCTKALEVTTQKDLPIDWAETQCNLAIAYSRRIKGDMEENIEKEIYHHNQAIKVFTQKDFPADWAKIQNNLASAFRARIRGDRAENIEQAIKYNIQALKMRTPQESPMDWAITQENLAEAYRDRIKGDRVENIEKSINYFQSALNIFKFESMPNDFYKVCRSLADIYFDMGQWKDALESYKSAIKADNFLYRTSLSVESKTIEVKQNASIYKNAAFAACRLNLAPEALLILEKGKTRLLSEALRLKMKRPQHVPNDVWAIYEQATEKYRNVTKSSNHKEDYAQKEKDVHRALEELNGSAKVVQGCDPNFQKELDVSDILSILDKETAMLTFCITDKGSIGFVISESKGIQSVDIPYFKKEDLNNLLFKPDEQNFVTGGWVGDYRSYHKVLGLENQDYNLHAWQKAINNVLSIISTKLFYPLLSELPNKIKRLIILPSEGLFLLPLHAVPHKCQPLCQRYCISYSPSIQLLWEMKNKAGKVEGKDLYAVINPQEDPSLAFSKCEGQAISDLFYSRQVNIGETGTRATVLDRIPGRAYLHFACHGSYDWNNPLQSGLFLAGGRTLSLADLQNDVVDLSSARLVTLSSCETGITDVIKSNANEFVGLPAGFMLAGVPCVVSSLWSVPDISTSLLMEKFYSFHIGGKDIPQALQDAQLYVQNLTPELIEDYLKKCCRSGKWEVEKKEEIEKYMNEIIKMSGNSQKPFQHPYYWAAFTVNGA